MNKLMVLAIFASLLMFFSIQPAHAHTTHLIEINGVDYIFVVGSLNEPIFVDDRTGVQLFVSLADPADPLNRGSPNSVPIEGLEDDLKVELIAGGETLVLDLEPAFRSPGEYQAVFYPTVATTLTYRFFGTIDGTPVDIDFTSGGVHGVEVDEEVEVLGEGVIRKASVSAFNTPQSRTDVGFPVQYVSNRDVQSAIEESAQGVDQNLAELSSSISSRLDQLEERMDTQGSNSGTTTLIIAGLAIVISFIAILLSRRK